MYNLRTYEEFNLFRSKNSEYRKLIDKYDKLHVFNDLTGVRYDNSFINELLDKNYIKISYFRKAFKLTVGNIFIRGLRGEYLYIGIKWKSGFRFCKDEYRKLNFELTDLDDSSKDIIMNYFDSLNDKDHNNIIKDLKEIIKNG